MKLMAILLVLVGGLYCALNVRHEYRGVTAVESPALSPSKPETYNKEEEPTAFRHAMNYNWFYSGSLLALGCLTLAWIRRSNRLDPLSPDFHVDTD